MAAAREQVSTGREPLPDGGDDHRGAIIRDPLLVAGRDAASLLECVDAALNHIPAPIPLSVEGERATTPRGPPTALVPPRGDGLGDAATAQQRAAGRAAVDLVGDDVVGPRGRPHPPGRFAPVPSSSAPNCVLSCRCAGVRRRGRDHGHGVDAPVPRRRPRGSRLAHRGNRGVHRSTGASGLKSTHYRESHHPYALAPTRLTALGALLGGRGVDAIRQQRRRDRQQNQQADRAKRAFEADSVGQRSERERRE